MIVDISSTIPFSTSPACPLSNLPLMLIVQKRERIGLGGYLAVEDLVQLSGFKYMIMVTERGATRGLDSSVRERSDVVVCPRVLDNFKNNLVKDVDEFAILGKGRNRQERAFM